jgi:hypothetical protein
MKNKKNRQQYIKCLWCSISKTSLQNQFSPNRRRRRLVAIDHLVRSGYFSGEFR